MNDGGDGDDSVDNCMLSNVWIDLDRGRESASSQCRVNE